MTDHDIFVENDTLAHYGVKGMKWGISRASDSENSYTAEEFITEHEDSITHHGVLGMKWGVRKARGGQSSNKPKTGTTKSPTPKKTASTSSSTSSKIAPKPTSITETASALRQSNELMRLQLENLDLNRKMKNISKQPESKTKKFLAEVASDSAKQIVKAVVVRNSVKIINKAIDKSGKIKK